MGSVRLSVLLVELNSLTGSDVVGLVSRAGGRYNGDGIIPQRRDIRCVIQI